MNLREAGAPKSLWRQFASLQLLSGIWTSLCVAAALSGSGRMVVHGTDAATFADAARSAVAGHRGNFALILIENGNPVEKHMMSIGKPVTEDTLFQAASVSKWVTAWGVMTLVEDGKVGLDAPVSRYLKRWKLPPSDYDNNLVTVRRLLSHTAGLNDDLGYCGFAPGARLQTLEQSLTEASDACPLRTGVVEVGAEPGNWRYSGGGFTLLQLLVEDVSGEPFAAFMQREVLVPLGMVRSTFITGAEGSNDVADFFASDGSPAPHNRYTATAAASLYTSAGDLARFAQAHWNGPNGEAPGRDVLAPKTLTLMQTPEASLLGSPYWGLGMRLYAPGRTIVGHDGGNVPAVANTIRVDPGKREAIIALGTGGAKPAHQLGSDWVALRRTEITLATVYGEAQRVMWWIIGGTAMILAGGGILIWRRRRALRI